MMTVEQAKAHLQATLSREFISHLANVEKGLRSRPDPFPNAAWVEGVAEAVWIILGELDNKKGERDD